MTITDTEFEEIVSSYDETAQVVHGICAACWPSGVVPSGTVAICGHTVGGGGGIPVSPRGKHRCAKCLNTYHWPCGHHA